MYPRQETVAMLLAGGQGSRLGILTKKIAKPAIPYGGKYRIIDFALSNCVNSGIEAVGVLTQYQPLILNEYIGSGQPWDLDNTDSGVTILPPYQRSRGGAWYSGTANAIYQNISYIERYNPDNVLIISGDHIYKMDYSKMIMYHKEKGAVCTIASVEVPTSETHRFGIINARGDGRIYKFEEKPKESISNMASMGVYVFNWQKLKKYLIKDNEQDTSSNDFGKDILPYMLEQGEDMFIYPFKGYWKDVGTIESLWQSNMDLIDSDSKLDLNESSWKIYSRNPVMPPHYVSKGSCVKDSIISDGCEIYGTVNRSVIFSGVRIEKGAKVENSIIMPGVKVSEGAEIKYSIVSENADIGCECRIGEDCIDKKGKKKLGITVVGPDIKVENGLSVPSKSMVENDVVKEG